MIDHVVILKVKGMKCTVVLDNGAGSSYTDRNIQSGCCEYLRLNKDIHG